MDSRQAIRLLKERANQRKLFAYRPYGHPDTLCPDGKLWKKMGWESWSNKPWQLEFHNAGINNKERMTMCANGVGKTYAGAAETAFHLTGLYPDWWEGHRFDKPVHFWIGSITNEIQRDYVQAILLGSDLGENLGTGFIPRELLVGKPTTRQAGISGVADTFKVRHKSGGLSAGQFKTYEQGWRKWQASAPNGVWLDEEPDANDSSQREIFSEVQTRIFRSSGILYVTYTPLLGQTPLTNHFMNPKSEGIYYTGATWDDVAHLKKEDKDRLIATYPSHLLDTRSKGIPMMGEGAIFTTPEEEIKVAPFEIPYYFSKIKGVDFGLDHPAAVVDIAWDRDKDIIYITRVWKKRLAKLDEHIQAINAVDPWVPVSWPHDGTNREKSSGVRLKDHYTQCRFLSKSACYKNDKLGSQKVESIIMEFQKRAANGGLKVFSTCHEFFQEYRNYHRKDGRPVALNDDVLKAAFYGVMMRRYATTKQNFQSIQQPSVPIVSMRR